jgi:hypothetical protein
MPPRPLLRGTLIGAGLAGGVVLLTGLLLTLVVEGPLKGQLGLALFMAFLAATVGGLVGPMFVRGREAPRRREGDPDRVEAEPDPEPPGSGRLREGGGGSP